MRMRIKQRLLWIYSSDWAFFLTLFLSVSLVILIVELIEPNTWIFLARNISFMALCGLGISAYREYRKRLGSGNPHDE